MKKSFGLFVTALFFCALLGSTGFSQSGQIIRLKDGSALKGMVTSLEDGVYTVETDALGEISINQDEVTSIANVAAQRTNPSAAAFPMPNNMQEQINNVQQTITSDPEAMKTMGKMLQDKEIMSILSDPEFIDEFLSFDLETIQKDPRTQKLLNNPEMQLLMQKMMSNSSFQDIQEGFIRPSSE